MPIFTEKKLPTATKCQRWALSLKPMLLPTVSEQNATLCVSKQRGRWSVCTERGVCAEPLSPSAHEEVPPWALQRSLVWAMPLEPKTREQAESTMWSAP